MYREMFTLGENYITVRQLIANSFYNYLYRNNMLETRKRK